MKTIHKVVLALVSLFANGTSNPAPQGNRTLEKIDALTHGPSPRPKQDNRNPAPPQKRSLLQKVKEAWMNPKETATTIGVGMTYGIVIGALLLLPFPPKSVQAQSMSQPLPLPAVPVVYEVHVMHGFVRLCASNAKAVNRIQRRRAVIAVRPLTRPAHLAFGKRTVVHLTRLSGNSGGRSRTKIKSTSAASNERASTSDNASSIKNLAGQYFRKRDRHSAMESRIHFAQTLLNIWGGEEAAFFTGFYRMATA